MTAASLEAMRARAREWLRESHNLRAAGFNLGAEEKRTDRLARDVLALLDVVEEREAALRELKGGGPAAILLAAAEAKSMKGGC